MPSHPLQPCATPGCPRRTTTGRCDQCRDTRQTNPRLRVETTAERGYGSPWRRRRLDYLEQHPYCTLCPRLADIPDHYPISRRQLVAQGDPDPDAGEHLRPLCRRCHDRETARHQPGGWWQQTMP